MKDVATLAGVGLATVSRVINGVPVDPALTDRVLAAARQLEYRKDTAATSLRRADRRTNTIGLVLEDVANPFSSALHRASPVDGVDTVVADNRGGVGQAVHALHASGHRRIGFVADRLTLWTARERLSGFTEAMAAAKCRTRPAWLRCDVHGTDAAREAVTRMFTGATVPTAVVTAQNSLTIGARQALVALGLHHTVAHVGFDDFPQAGMLDPPVTVIAQDPAEMGRRAATMLLERLDDATLPPRLVTLPTRYVARGSGELTP